MKERQHCVRYTYFPIPTNYQLCSRHGQKHRVGKFPHEKPCFDTGALPYFVLNMIFNTNTDNGFSHLVGFVTPRFAAHHPFNPLPASFYEGNAGVRACVDMAPLRSYARS